MVALIEEEIVKALSHNEGVALATVTYRTGSAPRGVGAKMLIRSDGSSTGSIGGGCVEAEVWQEAKCAIETGEAKTLRFELTPEKLAEGGLICGGTVEMFIEPLLPANPDLLPIYKTIVNLKKGGGRGSLLATLVSVAGTYSRAIKAKVLIDLEGHSIGSLLDDPELIERLRPEVGPLIRENRTRMLSVQRDDKRIDILLEPIRSEPTVFIFGCGHISTCLAPLAKTVGFRVVVIDDRPTFANRERFPEAEEVLVAGFDEVFDRLKIDENAYLVIVTRGHIYDGNVLEQALRTRARYIGMIGSRRKIGTLYANLMKKGISRDLLKRVHAPIGLDIAAETPEEIAISIMAELIQVRAERK